MRSIASTYCISVWRISFYFQKKLMKNVLIAIFALMQISLFAQQTTPNLIENPSFEASDATGSPVLGKSPQDFENKCKIWLAPWEAKPGIMDSMVKHTVGRKIVGNILFASEGRKFVRMTVHGCYPSEEKGVSCRSCLGQQLKTPLQKGKIYKIKMDAARWPWAAINKLGFFFSEKPVKKEGMQDWRGDLIRPQLVFDSILCKIPMTWYRLSATFKADMDIAYFYFGNFAALNDYQKIYNELSEYKVDFYNAGYYFFDNFSLTEIQNVHNSLSINYLPQYSITCLSETTLAAISVAPSATIAQPAIVLAPKQKIVLNNVLFETNSANLKKVQLPELDEFCQKLLKNPQLTLLITGHTDNVGTPIQNQQLSEKRANTIADYLQRKGIDAKRIQKRGLGATQPISDNQTVEGREKNRRVEIEIN
jgi:outer membrane protein OmpA-like peptidoglycan-associated protein